MRSEACASGRLSGIAHRNELVRALYPMFAAMAEQVANPQVRNQGTLGGDLCYGDPSTDPPGCLMALGAEVVLASSRGERVLSQLQWLQEKTLAHAGAAGA